MLNKLILLFALSFPLTINAQINPLSVDISSTTCDSIQLMQHVIKNLTIIENGNDMDADIYAGSPLVSYIDDKTLLTCQDTLIIFEDLPEDEHGYYSYFTFLGQLKTNSPYAPFVIEASFSEYTAVMLINNITGDEIFLFNNPILSPDKKHVIVFDKEPFNETDFQLSIYKVGEKSLNYIASITYPLCDIYWSRQGVWNEDGSVIISFGNGLPQERFLKLEIDIEQLNSL